MLDYSWPLNALIAIAAFLVGLSKGGLPGIGNLSMVILAVAMPTKASVGFLLPILIVGDVVAVLIYRREAEWSYILRLLPSVAVGLILGYLAFAQVDDRQMRNLIGFILLTMTAVHFGRKWLRKRKTNSDELVTNRAFISATGATAGFATMVANAAGPVASLYFAMSGLPKLKFIGTAAWFFLIVNLIKVPFMHDLGVLDLSTLSSSLQYSIFTVVGALLGPRVIRHINQSLFEVLIWIFVIIGGLKLISL